MFSMNLQPKGELMISYEGTGNTPLKKIKKEELQRKIEIIQFGSKMMQRDLEKLNYLLPVIKVLSFSKEVGKIDIYIDKLNFGRKKPEYTIYGNIPLYKELKHYLYL